MSPIPEDAIGQWADAGAMPSCQAEFHPSVAVSLNAAGWTTARPLSTAGHRPAWVVCLENHLRLIDSFCSRSCCCSKINCAVIITINKIKGSHSIDYVSLIVVCTHECITRCSVWLVRILCSFSVSLSSSSTFGSFCEGPSPPPGTRRWAGRFHLSNVSVCV